MNEIKKYVPNVCMGSFNKERYSFNNLDELMNTPFMKRTIAWNKKYLKNVSSLKYVAVHKQGEYLLECQYIKNGEFKSYIIGQLKNTEGLE